MDKRTTEGLYLFKSLVKDGCEWHGDVISRKWSEQLYIPEGCMNQVLLTVSTYADDTYQIDGNCVWIA